MSEFKKKHTEVLSLYKLEKGLKDIYVEGNSDKVFYEYFLKSKGSKKKVIPIEIIDFSDLENSYSDGFDMKSNRNKLIILSKLFSDKLNSYEIKCIIDKDFDDYIASVYNKNLLRTDFSCLEAYLFTEEVLDKFLDIGIPNFPFKSDLILTQLSNVLKSLFCLRLFRELNYCSTKLVNFDGNLSINKQNGKIEFNESEYLGKYINKNNLTTCRDEIIELYKEQKKKLNSDIRNNLNGHDFLDIFFLYINKIKNTSKFKEENLGRSLFLAVETSTIENFRLFREMIK